VTGGMGQITGYRLRFDPSDPTQGIFFVNGSATRVTVAGKNDPSELIFLIPASLTPGDYSLEVRSTMGRAFCFSLVGSGGPVFWDCQRGRRCDTMKQTVLQRPEQIQSTRFEQESGGKPGLAGL
jgi:hypothetical protein